MNSLHARLLHFENHVHHRLVLHSVRLLRISLGIVFLGFGLLKFFPDVSPAQDLTLATTHYLFLGLVPDGLALVLVASLECVIGICLFAGPAAMRLGVWLLAAQFVGILSPLVLLPARLFDGPYHAPTLEGQYVIKDIVLVTAALVVAAGTFRGGHMVRDDLPPGSRAVDGDGHDAEDRLRIVLDGIDGDTLLGEVCERHGITEADFCRWRDSAYSGATIALADDIDREPDD